MTKYTIFKTMASGKELYRLLETGEAAGQFPGIPAVKCEEGLFLLSAKEGLCVLDTGSGKAVSPEELPSAGSELAGWHAELCFGPGYVVPCDFSEGSVQLDGETVPATIKKIRPSLYLLKAEDDPFTLVLDVSRFLLYGALEGKWIGGYIKNMPQT